MIFFANARICADVTSTIPTNGKKTSDLVRSP